MANGVFVKTAVVALDSFHLSFVLATQEPRKIEMLSRGATSERCLPGTVRGALLYGVYILSTLCLPLSAISIQPGEMLLAATREKIGRPGKLHKPLESTMSSSLKRPSWEVSIAGHVLALRAALSPFMRLARDRCGIHWAL